MAGRRIVYRKKHQNRLSMFLVTVVVIMILVVVAIRCMTLRSKLDSNQAKEKQYEEMIAGEEKRSEEIEEYRKYTQTKKYAEEVAKDKLGLVHEGEIIFREED